TVMQESDITRRKIVLNKSDVEKVAHESIFRIFGRKIANAFRATWRFVTKPVRFFFSLFKSSSK
uniref:Uncharacterized protein n=1 Tax=Amphimedon queenslandica TaxID=400682 RepID=A0A1X7SNR9_AMPQE